MSEQTGEPKVLPSRFEFRGWQIVIAALLGLNTIGGINIPVLGDLTKGVDALVRIADSLERIAALQEPVNE